MSTDIPITLQVIFWTIVVVVVYLLSCIRILYEYQRGVVFRLGRVLPAPKGPGLIFVFWPIDRLVRVGLRTFVQDVPPQDVITRDNVSVKVNAVVYYRVVDPMKAVLEVEDFRYATHQLSQTTLRSILGQAVLEVEDFRYATHQLSQTTLRSILGQAELDELLAERERINRRLQEVIDSHSDPWGVKVSLVEVKHVDLPAAMQRAMAKQAETERERRAKVIHAEGEFQAASKLRDAAAIIEEQPKAMVLRYLQTLVEVGAEQNTTIIFPIPIELLLPMLRGEQTTTKQT